MSVPIQLPAAAGIWHTPSAFSFPVLVHLPCAPPALSAFWLLIVRREVMSLKCRRLERELELKAAVFVRDEGAPVPSLPLPV